MFRRFAKRSHQLERLDTGDYTPREYAKWQSEMCVINRFLGDTRALRLSLQDELRECGDERYSILDVGAGSGELLKNTNKSKEARNAFLVGAELNAGAARSINKLSAEFGILGVQCNALQLPFADDSFDFVISSLFLHHLNDEQASTFIIEMNRVAKKKFVVIDLRRNAAAYYLYRMFGPLFFQHFSVEDGSLSILRSFRDAELRELVNKTGIPGTDVKRRAVFRLVLSGTKVKKTT